MEVRIQKVRLEAIIPEYKTDGSAGFDFTLIEDVVIAPNGLAKVPTGLAIAVPSGYVLLVFSRSSGPMKTGTTMANGVGVVDSDYCGPEDEIFYLVQNLTDRELRLEKGMRVAQGVIVPFLRADFVEGMMEAPNRGGHGSTGQ